MLTLPKPRLIPQQNASVRGGTEIIDSVYESTYESPHSVVAPFHGDEIVLGRIIGSGSFCNVYEINAINLARNASRGYTPDENAKRQEMAKEVSVTRGRYVVKRLKPGLREHRNFFDYVADIVSEAELLLVLNHPNIVKMHGICAASNESILEGRETFFLILERLGDTLDDRIDQWADERDKKVGAKFAKIARGLPSKRAQSLHDKRTAVINEEQLRVSSSVACAIDYLHENNIIFRDLKPENIGFDCFGNVKLFDFGLARSVPSLDCDTSSTAYRMSGVGTPRYSAPEVLKVEPYNLKADVYSFSCVLWEILTLERPFSEYGRRDQFLHALIETKVTPKINPCWPEHVREAFQAGFSRDFNERPSIGEFFETLQKCQAVETQKSSPPCFRANKSNVSMRVRLTALRIVIARRMRGESRFAKRASCGSSD